MEKIYEIKFIETEYNYLFSVISSLTEIQKKIPKNMQTKNSEILMAIYNKLKLNL